MAVSLMTPLRHFTPTFFLVTALLLLNTVHISTSQDTTNSTAPPDAAKSTVPTARTATDGNSDLILTPTSTSSQPNSAQRASSDNSVRTLPETSNGGSDVTPEEVGLALTLDDKSDFFRVSWTMKHQFKADVSGLLIGYKLLIKDGFNGKNSVEIDKLCTPATNCSDVMWPEFLSTELPSYMESFPLFLPTAEKIRVCIYLKMKSTDNSKKDDWRSRSACSEVSNTVKDESSTNYRWVTGILASVVFLVPSIGVLCYILRMDRRVQREEAKAEDEKKLITAPTFDTGPPEKQPNGVSSGTTPTAAGKEDARPSVDIGGAKVNESYAVDIQDCTTADDVKQINVKF